MMYKKILTMKSILNLTIGSILVLLMACSTTPDSDGEADTTIDKDERMAWWREAKFGLFIHCGVYAVPAGK